MARRYTEVISEASTFRNRFAAQEAVAQLDNCKVGCAVSHEIHTRGDGRCIIYHVPTGSFFADNIGNKYSSRLNEARK